MSIAKERLARISPTAGSRQLLGQIRESQQADAAQLAQQQAAQGGTLEAQNLEREARIAAAETDQARLESEHGKLATIGTQAGRGALDAILSSGALAGAAWEGVGEVFGLEGVKQQGRDLGRASSGEALIEAASFLFGGGGKAGLTTAERVSRDVAEQQKAWPTLSAVSHTGGMLVPMAAGGLAAAGSKAAPLIAMGAFEGAGGGAQIAYESNASLRDVLSSTLVGGALGAAAAGAGVGVTSMVQSKSLKAAARELAEDANLKAAGVGRTDLKRFFGQEAGVAEAKATELAEEIAGYRFKSGPMEGKPITRLFRTQEGIQEGVEAARAETSAAVAAARQEVAQAAETAGVAAAADVTEDTVEKVLVAMGKDPTEFQALRKQAQSFNELSSIIGMASKTEPSALSTAIGAVTSAGSLISGVGSLPALAKGLLSAVGARVVEQRSASTIAVLANNLVTDTVANALGHVSPVLTASAAGAAGRAGGKATAPEVERPKPLTPQERQERYRDQLDKVNKAVTQPDIESEAERLEAYGDLPPALLIAASADMGQKMAQLQQDMPKPTPNLRGKAYETMSSEQVRLANAMYEATVSPMSVFSDFGRGVVDYDKVRYAWKQYPGLQQAAQAGLMDILHTQMTEQGRSRVSDSMLTQMDNLFGFDGALQPSLDRGFAGRMTALGAQAREQQNPPPKPGKLNNPAAAPTMTQRLAGSQ